MSERSGTARDLLASALEVEAGSLPADASIDTVDRWDSIAHMRLILIVETRLGRSLEPQEVVEIFSVEDIDRLLAAGGARS